MMDICEDIVKDAVDNKTASSVGIGGYDGE
jgi:hypothetical protein